MDPGPLRHSGERRGGSPSQPRCQQDCVRTLADYSTVVSAKSAGSTVDSIGLRCERADESECAPAFQEPGCREAPETAATLEQVRYCESALQWVSWGHTMGIMRRTRTILESGDHCAMRGYETSVMR